MRCIPCGKSQVADAGPDSCLEPPASGVVPGPHKDSSYAPSGKPSAGIDECRRFHCRLSPPAKLAFTASRAIWSLGVRAAIAKQQSTEYVERLKKDDEENQQADAVSIAPDLFILSFSQQASCIVKPMHSMFLNSIRMYTAQNLHSHSHRMPIYEGNEWRLT